MARKARQRISYVLPLPNSPGGHRLGVNSLALDRRGILYSAGRDGSICSWDLHTDLTQSARPTPTDDDPVDGEKSINAPLSPSDQSTTGDDDDDDLPLASPRTPRARPSASSFRSQVQAHTHWVNDIVLTSGADAVVSCSSDLTVKLWRPESRDNTAPATLGLHSDYVKCLAAPGADSGTVGDWVASGGLDRKIRLWDLKEGKGEILSIDVGDGGTNPKGSIYSLGIGGGILASGGPESVVRVWDPRSGKRITKFVGHTDLVRAILVSEQGNVILTASSDSTVKMWSVTGGRCMHTLTMHNDSVWSLCSSHPSLEVFHSSDRSGLVAKTDIRDVREIEEGICVALCQEQEGVSKVISDGGLDEYVWTATSSSRIHRWLDIDTNLEIGGSAKAATSPVWRTHQHRVSNASYVSRMTATTNGKHRPSLSIPVASLLRLSTTSAFPSSQNVRDPDSVTVYSLGYTRQASISEALMNNEDGGDPKPLRDMADETIEGQNGLIKHVLLNDRRRVLTLDTAGEVVEWDLVKCSVVKAWGKRHLDEVTPLVNTLESVANWCQVDTRTGSLACVLEENYCFDAEMYADELELEEHIEFREDQRINLGKWVLRYLFSNLIDEEIKRDEDYRKFINEARGSKDAIRRANAPPSISLPSSNIVWSNVEHATSGILQSATTPRPLTGRFSGYPATTPGMTIGLATPASAYFPGNSPQEGNNNSQLPELTEEDGAAKDDPTTPGTESGHDYFSGTAAAVATPTTPGATTDDEHSAIPPVPPIPAAVASSLPPPPTTPSTSTPVFPSTEATPGAAAGSSKLGGLGKLWGQATKRASRVSGEDKDKKAAVNAAAAADKPAEEVAEVKAPEPLNDNLLALIRKIRQGYDETVSRDHKNATSAAGTTGTNELVKSAICPSLPNETPVLKHPSNMVVMIQEDRPDSGGVADLYRGTVGELGRDADILENVAPAWLGEAILMNRTPTKEIVKVSFVLQPWNETLPSLPSTTEGNSRLNANRMLRARKILAYIAERLDPLPEQAGGGNTGLPPLKPEEWLEVLIKDEVVPTNMTLGTMRAHVWKTGGDVMLFYRIKGGEAAIMPGGGSSSAPMVNGTSGDKENST